jgi:heat-inducible transcriptional repressor
MATPQRRHQILALIVDDYVDKAQPVGSKALIERHGLTLSSATVRNEMAVLESEGLLTHPHTSAGRVPSDEGYRFYVRSLMPDREMPGQEQLTILHQFHQAARDIEAWLQLATGVLAQGLGNVALATPPRERTIRLRRLQLIEITEDRALLVVVTAEANVIQHTLDLSSIQVLPDLTAVAARLTEQYGGLTAAEIRAHLDDAGHDPLELLVLDWVVRTLDLEEQATLDPAAIEGVRDMLRQPEFGNADRVLDALDAIEERQLGRALPLNAIEPGSVAIVIGDENREEPYRDMSFVLSHYGTGSGAGGVIGILGPTRMHYGDAVAYVRYVAEVLSQLLGRFYGDEEA